MSISQALGQLIHDWGWLIAWGLFLGTGETIVRVADGRRRLARERSRREGAELANASLRRQLDHVLGLPPATPEDAPRWEPTQTAGGDAR